MSKPNLKTMTQEQITNSLLVTNGHLLACIATTLLHSKYTTMSDTDMKAMRAAVEHQQDILNSLLRKSIPENTNE